MHSLVSALAFALAIGPSLAVPPENFGFPSAPNHQELTVVFPHDSTNTPVTEADKYGIDIPENKPMLGIDPRKYPDTASYNGPYLIMMVDPDASTPQNPSSRFILHWLQPNVFKGNMSSSGLRIMGQLDTSSQGLVPYRRPAPPPTSDAHRYIIYAYQQPRSNFSLPMGFGGFSAMNRTNFNLTQFVAAARLDDPVAAEYFYVANKTGIPSDFTAPASQNYPGGDGGAVTSGPGPMPSPTSSMGGSSMTPTGSSSSASSSAGAPLAASISKGSSAVMAVLGMVFYAGL